MSDFLNYSVPWWMWGIPTSVLLVALFIFAARTLGLRNAIAATAVAAAAILTKLAGQKGRQQGWNDRKEREAKTSRKAKETIEDAYNRANLAVNSDPERLREDDGHRRVD